MPCSATRCYVELRPKHWPLPTSPPEGTATYQVVQQRLESWREEKRLEIPMGWIHHNISTATYAVFCASASSRGGGIVFIHRFGSSLNAHPHLHLIVFDGVIARTGEHLHFHPERLNANDIEVLREAIRLRMLCLFKRRCLLEPEVLDNLKAWGHGGGFSIHTDVRLHAHDKHGRERLTWIREGERLLYRFTNTNQDRYDYKFDQTVNW